ncbi:hypothetical protein [Polyangium aurulentum]|uniref:hypothetical protein n=1 Tax=Polyangium aurulentum TaxID=2567896 RepID=UPI0010ADFC95|nr:hypothetical protein [Polyangium aurulentum]UQA59791.1 hypothetical protein E8A73_004630 [Polyangium aurulentum]
MASTSLFACVAQMDGEDGAEWNEENIAEVSQAEMCEDCEPTGGGGTTGGGTTGGGTTTTTVSNKICNYHWVGSYCDMTCCTLVSDDIVSCSTQTVSSDQCVNPPPAKHFRTIYSEKAVAHWATFLNGASGDEWVNNNVYMPAGCELISVSGVHYHDGAPQTSAQTVDHGSHGYSAYKASSSVTGLSAKIHWWHEWNSSITVRAAYSIKEPDGVDCSVPGATRGNP